MTKALSLGIDIGGTNTAYGVVNEQGEILYQNSIATKGYVTAYLYVDALYRHIVQNVPPQYLKEVKGIGIGAPSANYYRGTIEHAPNMEWTGIIPLKSLIEDRFKLQTWVTNDANAAAMGEMLYGAAKDMRDFIMVTLGTGVGSGFVSNGKLIYGHDGFAGELGHVIAVREGRACGCGRRGCLETYTSATGIVVTAKEFLDFDNKESELRLRKNISAKDIFEAALNQDEMALSIFEFTGKILGQTLADAVAITSPEAIILFGGLAKAGNILFEPTKKYLESNLLNLYQGKVRLIPSLLKESDVAILGAAALVE